MIVLLKGGHRILKYSHFYVNLYFPGHSLLCNTIHLKYLPNPPLQWNIWYIHYLFTIENKGLLFNCSCHTLLTWTCSGFNTLLCWNKKVHLASWVDQILDFINKFVKFLDRQKIMSIRQFYSTLIVRDVNQFQIFPYLLSW